MKTKFNASEIDISFVAFENALRKSLPNPHRDFSFFESIYKTECHIPKLGKVKVDNRRISRAFTFQSLYFEPEQDVYLDLTPVKANVGFSFYLNGRADCVLVNLGTELPMIPGTGIICVSNYGRAALKLSKNVPFLNVTLFIKSEAFAEFMGDNVKHYRLIFNCH